MIQTVIKQFAFVDQWVVIGEAMAIEDLPWALPEKWPANNKEKGSTFVMPLKS